MAKIIKIDDKYEAAFRNRLKSQGIEIPSQDIKVKQLHNPFVISVNSEEAFEKIKNALKDTKVLKDKASVSLDKQP